MSRKVDQSSIATQRAARAFTRRGLIKGAAAAGAVAAIGPWAIRDARAAMHQVDDDRVWLQRTLTRIASAAGNPILLASGNTDKNGSAVPVLRGNPATPSGNPTSSEPTFTGSTFASGPIITVLDAGGNLMMTWGPAGNQVNPSPTP